MFGVEKYRHHLGVHCASAALRNVHFHHCGELLSEAMCFGLAGGLNFTYVREFGAPFYMVMGRGSFMERRFCDAMNIALDVTHTDDAALAWMHLRQRLEAGALCMIDTDMFELPYMVQRLSLDSGAHFGGHKALVIGYDAAADAVHLADYAWHTPRVVSLTQLQQARDSRQCPSRPRNAAFEFRYPDVLPPMEEALQSALRTMVAQMRYPFRHFNGLPAIDRFCRQVPKWKLTMTEEELQTNSALACFMLEKAGTGGGAFRNLYGRFLREAADRLGAPVLARVSSIYLSLARDWREVAQLLDEGSKDPSRGMFAGYPQIRSLMNSIAAREEQAVDTITQWLAEVDQGYEQ